MVPSICFDIITLFPEMFQAVTHYGVTGRAFQQGLLKLHCWNPRDFVQDVHRTVDDRPYGGGPGMVMKVEPLRTAIRTARAATNLPSRVIALSPQGRLFTQSAIQPLLSVGHLILVCGRYEGIDERVLQQDIDEEWSVGDYVLTGGELPAMILIDALVRHVPGVLGKATSAQEDSFAQGLLDAPHYTRPAIIDGVAVPPVLLSGDHAKVNCWRLKQSLGRTWLRRPELLKDLALTDQQQQLLAEFQQEHVEQSSNSQIPAF